MVFLVHIALLNFLSPKSGSAPAASSTASWRSHSPPASWCIYALDQKRSFGTSLPFTIQDVDMGTNHFEPGTTTTPHFNCVINYACLSTKIWLPLWAGRVGRRPQRRITAIIWFSRSCSLFAPFQGSCSLNSIVLRLHLPQSQQQQPTAPSPSRKT
ncbi:hypothetical protein BJX61DRAFT_34405 [Aspergillus egyptiacus]|nr:hypothetical protein BJX61DRAFT_34405 [Aspergillus egyptiacus]